MRTGSTCTPHGHDRRWEKEHDVVCAGIVCQVSIGSDAVDAAQEYLATGQKTGRSAIEQISWVQSPAPR